MSHFNAEKIIELQNRIKKLKKDKQMLFDELRRVRDWIIFAANSEGGIVREMDDVFWRLVQ